ncbi:dihydroorotate dehydrogenase B catalytic subunit [Candidatus Poribacteria bacterium]|nr:dihydroorotate dehydrogenase B catalytic subunit [Candidatus Poribacteria bacterium]
MTDLSVNIGGMSLKNPVMTASGTFGYGSEYAEFVDLNRLGAVGLKSITVEPREGNAPPRIAETEAGMLNSIGLQNVGIDAFISDKLPYLKQFDTRTLVNLSGRTVADYVELCGRLDGTEGVHGLELNVSCPNVDSGGMEFGVDASMLGALVEACRGATTLPLIVKLSPNVTSVVDMARVCESAGADGISLINTLLGMAINVETRRAELSRGMGGLSGPALKPVAVRMVWQVYNAVSLPIIGMGGISTTEDALEFIIAGASAIAVGTANFVNPRTTMEVVDGLESYFRRHEIPNLAALRGTCIVG